MATTYTKSYITDFGSSFNQSQFHSEIDAEAGIAPNLLQVDKTGDVIDIIFDAALSAGEQTTLDTLISNHTPDTSKAKEQFFIINPKRESIKTSTYSTVAVFKYGGSIALGTIDYINIISYMDSGPTSYCTRVMSKTSNVQIAEKTGLTNTTEAINDMGTITNVPTTEEIFELQVKRMGGEQ